jgi:hypothetical protein
LRRLKENPGEDVPPKNVGVQDRTGCDKDCRRAPFFLKDRQRIVKNIRITIVECHSGGPPWRPVLSDLAHKPSQWNYITLLSEVRYLACKALWRHSNMPWIVGKNLDPVVQEKDGPLDADKVPGCPHHATGELSCFHHGSFTLTARPATITAQYGS